MFMPYVIERCTQNEGGDLLTGKLFDDSFPSCKCCQDSCDVRVY